MMAVNVGQLVVFRGEPSRFLGELAITDGSAMRPAALRSYQTGDALREMIQSRS